MTVRRRDPLACILPPVLLERVARNGDAEQRSRALDTLLTDTSLRSARLQGAGRVRGPSLRPLLDPELERPQRSVYTANGAETLPGELVRAEGQAPTGDVAVDEAYDGLGDTHRFYSDAYGRASVDDEGLPLQATVHFGQAYDNAFWDGSQMVFGDGDGDLFHRFTVAVDVIGHELTHGVVDDELGLHYTGQSGALNESVSDVFGSLVKQHRLRQSAGEADWLIGTGLFTEKVQGSALRSMAAPGTAFDDPVLGKDPQPAHLRDFVHTTKDNGGVHINSGIPNHAFHLAATALGGFAWERAGRIWYDALRDARLRPTTRFATFARATVRAAQHGFGPTEVQAVTAAWQQVGVLP